MGKDPVDLVTDKVQALNDIELAVLVCLVAEQHCIIESEESLLDGVEKELQSIAADVFGLSCRVLRCSESTTPDDFGNGILVTDAGDDSSFRGKETRGGQHGAFARTETSETRAASSANRLSLEDGKRIANVVIARDLNRASDDVQVQALELIRGKRIFTRTAVYATPAPFVFVALNATGTSRLNNHLNDQFFISHKHLAEHGFSNSASMELENSKFDGDDASMSSIVRSPPDYDKRDFPSITFGREEIDHFKELVGRVKISSEVRMYLHNIVVFMRLHRAVGGGVSAMATRHFTAMSHALAPLHGLDYITPSLVSLAARKIYLHRIKITAPEQERSMQWGSSLEAVKAVLEGVTVEDVIEEVLESVEVPL